MQTAEIIPRLRFSEDWRTLVFLGVGLFLLAGNWSGILRNFGTVGLSVFFCFIGCVIAHNHMHRPVFAGRGWNAGFQVFLSFAIGQPPTGILTAHNERHHGHPESELDFVRTDLVRFRWNFLNILAFPFASIVAMYREKPSDLAIWKRKRPRLFRQAVLERVVFYSVLIGLLVIDFRSTLLFLVLPWIFAQLALVGMNLFQHQDCDHGSAFDHSRNLTGKLANWFLLNNGFHTAHHLRPSLHWSELPAWHRCYVEPNMNLALNHRTFTGLVLARLRRRPSSHVR